MFYFPTIKSKATTYNCNKCGLGNKPLPLTVGENYNGLVIVGDRIGRVENEKQKPFMGQSGKILRSCAIKNKVNLAKDAAITNATLCYFSGKPSEVYTKCCRNILKENLLKLKPKLIICLGEIAINSVLGVKEKQSITKMRNRIIPSHEFNCLIYSTYNPAALLYEDNEDRTDKTKEQTFYWDLEKILFLWKVKYHVRKNVDKILQERRILDNIEIIPITKNKELDNVEKIINKQEFFSFDYETTNLKPYDDYFKIYSIGFGIPRKSFVIYIPDFQDEDYLKQICYKLLQNSKIKKYIQNDKFEELCSRYWFNKPGKRIINNSFCSMLATHVIDERKGCTSLDFQNLVRFGIHPYSDKVNRFIKSGKGEKTNSIHLCPKEDLIKYNGLDCITTLENSLILDNVLLNSENKREAYDFLHDGIECFCDIEENGIKIDIEELNSCRNMLLEHQSKVLDSCVEMSEVKSFLKEKYGKDGVTRDNLECLLRSPKQMQEYLYDTIGLTPIKKIKTGYSVDAEVIQYHAEQDEDALCKKISDYRKIEKAIGTSLNDIERNVNGDGKAHPSLWLNTTATFRSASSDFNSQNLPKHGELISGFPYKNIRKVIVPTNKKYILGEIDVVGSEVMVAGMLSKDDVLLKDLASGFDMHSYFAGIIFGIDKPLEIIKAEHEEERFLAKNNFTFANIYLASHISMAKSIRQIEFYKNYISEIFFNKKFGKQNFENFFIEYSENQIKEAQDAFFKRYFMLKAWQEEQLRFYYKHKYIESSLGGFRRNAPLKSTEIVNFDIQHCSFMLLLDACIKTNKILKKEKMKSKLITETHDSKLFDIYKPEKEDVIEIAENIIKNPRFEFAQGVEIRVDWSFGKNWCEMEET